MTNKCNLTTCTLQAECQRFHPCGEMRPIMPFLTSMEKLDGPYNGCADFWPVGTGTEYFSEDLKTKTPVKK